MVLLDVKNLFTNISKRDVLRIARDMLYNIFQSDEEADSVPIAPGYSGAGVLLFFFCPHVLITRDTLTICFVSEKGLDNFLAYLSSRNRSFQFNLYKEFNNRSINYLDLNWTVPSSKWNSRLSQEFLLIIFLTILIHTKWHHLL